MLLKSMSLIFGAQRIRGKRGRGVYGKTIVLGVLKRQEKVYTEIVPGCSKTTLQAIIRGHVAPDAIIHSDEWHDYDWLVDIGFDKHFRVHHSNNELPVAIGILTASNLSGVLQKGVWQSSTAFLNIPFICIWKKQNFDLIIVVIIFTSQFLQNKMISVLRHYDPIKICIVVKTNSFRMIFLVL